MAKKDYFLIVDTETTQNGMVADFGAVVCDRKGRIIKQCAVMVNGVYGTHPLFFDSSAPADSLWSGKGRDRRLEMYDRMLEDGTRMVASVAAVNRWLERVRGEFDPILTAYNIAFDSEKCRNTGIDLTIFSRSFCLWHSCVEAWAYTKKYRNFIIEHHLFNAPTKLGNMSFKTNAEVMTRFVNNDINIPDEPHTAIEDVIGYELPLLVKLVKGKSKKDFMNPEPFNWRALQVKDHFTAK